MRSPTAQGQLSDVFLQLTLCSTTLPTLPKVSLFSEIPGWLIFLIPFQWDLKCRKCSNCVELHSSWIWSNWCWWRADNNAREIETGCFPLYMYIVQCSILILNCGSLCYYLPELVMDRMVVCPPGRRTGSQAQFWET